MASLTAGYVARMLARAIRKLIYPRYVIGARPGPPPWPELERHLLPTDEGPLEYWFLPARREHEGPRPVVLFAHGNGELIDDWPMALSRYRELGVHLVLVEFRGYGESPGQPCEAHLVSDFVAVARIVRERADVDAGRVLYHGRSLGGGVACAASLAEPPSALILQSTFASLLAMGRRFGAPAFVMPERYDNRAAMRALTGPCLIFHGDADRLIPLTHAHALCAENPRAELCVVPGADHNAPIHLTRDYWPRIGALLERV